MLTHSSAPGNNAFMGSGTALIPGTTLSPVPACKEDYSRMKLTSFDKLMGMTCSSIKNVRLHCDADLKLSGGVGTSGMAPDAAYASPPPPLIWLLIEFIILILSLQHAYMIQ
jgi:phosphatidylinositol 3,5-bisphosphate 5-phosphatase